VFIPLLSYVRFFFRNIDKYTFILKRHHTELMMQMKCNPFRLISIIFSRDQSSAINVLMCHRC